MYRTIDSKFWTDPKIKSLDTPAKLLAMYLVTSPRSHVGGIYYLSRSSINEETGLADRVSRAAMDTLSKVGFARYDDKTQVVWVVNMFAYQGRGPKNEICVANYLPSLHDSVLIQAFLEYYPSVLKHVKQRKQDRVSSPGFCEAKEQEQEQDKDQDKEQDCDVVATNPKKFVRPTVEEVSDYCRERNNKVDPEKWFDYYTSNGWKVGRSAMSDWRAAVRTWEKNNFNSNGKTTSSKITLTEAVMEGYDWAAERDEQDRRNGL